MWRDVILNLVGVTLFVLIAYLAYRDSEKITRSFAGVIVLLFFGRRPCADYCNADRIETLKVSSGGFEAKTRELEGVLTTRRLPLRHFTHLPKLWPPFRLSDLPLKDGGVARALYKLRTARRITCSPT